MCKFSLVAPNAIMRQIVEQEPGLIGDYLMCICTDVLEDPLLYKEIRKKHPDATIIMDNGVVETGAPLDEKVLVHAARICEANVVILPDYMNDYSMTSSATLRAAERWSMWFPPETGFMAVVQGTSLMEYVDCASWQASMTIPNPMYWGIPKMAQKNLGTRRELTRTCHFIQPSWPIHLLGFSNDIQDDMHCATLPGVVGIDSAVPVRIGSMGAVCHPGNIDQMHVPRDNFWELFSRGSLQIFDSRAISQSVRRMREAFA